MKPRTVLAGAVLVVAAMGAKEAPAVTAGHPARGSAHASGGTKDCAQLEALWKSAGGAPGAAFMAAEIATAESSGQQYASLADSNGTVDRGYWQINTSHGSLSTFDAYGNARAAVLISKDGTDWSPWVTYQIGAYQGKC